MRVLAIIGLFAILGLLSPIVVLLLHGYRKHYPTGFIAIIMVGQGVLGRKAELQSEEQFNTTINTYHDIEQIMEHLSAQDAELLKQSHMLFHMIKSSGIVPEELLAEINTGVLTTHLNNPNNTTTSTQPTE